MIALLVALSLATPASHGHKSTHPHRHKHAPVHARRHKHAPVNAAERCSSDAGAVQALERRIASAEMPEAELSKLEKQLESAIERARRDCA
jgi:hypothetical protein